VLDRGDDPVELHKVRPAIRKGPAPERVKPVTRHSKVLSIGGAYIVNDGRPLPKLVCNNRPGTSELSGSTCSWGGDVWTSVSMPAGLLRRDSSIISENSGSSCEAWTERQTRRKNGRTNDFVVGQSFVNLAAGICDAPRPPDRPTDNMFLIKFRPPRRVAPSTVTIWYSSNAGAGTSQRTILSCALIICGYYHRRAFSSMPAIQQECY